MKPAFSYYGGKQRMSRHIVPLIPRHTVYVEPFAGGAAVFFAKPWPDVTNNHHYREVLNDIDGRIVNFYKVLRDEPEALVRACSLTPYSRREHNRIARESSADPVEQARRWFVDIQQGHLNKSRSGWGVQTRGMNLASTWVRKCAALGGCADRLTGVYVEGARAMDVIARWDSPQTLFVCDPPYPGADQGHYSGYTSDDFDALVGTLDQCQGSFLLSNYDQPGIPDDWERFDFAANSGSAGGRNGKGRGKRTEVVWRKIRGYDQLSPELRKVYDSGKLDCFTGEKYRPDENHQPVRVTE